MRNAEKVASIIKKYQTHEGDTGSSEVQIAILSDRIAGLTEHLKNNAKDHSSRRGLMKLVSQRKSLMTYLKKHGQDRYSKLVASLEIRG